MKKTKIIATIGPASESKEILKEMALAGKTCARFTCSHGTHEEQLRKIQTVKEVREELGLPIAILLDTKGPEIRFRDFENGSVILKKDDIFVLTAEDKIGNQQIGSITYDKLYQSVSEGVIILVDDGKISLQVLKIEGKDIICKVLVGGKISNHKGINVPDTPIDMPYISEVDKKDLLFGIQQEVDYIALSFVRSADDVLEIRKFLKENGTENIRLISKIENMQGIGNIKDIIEVSDGIMVARGDMGVEVNFTKLPYIQKEIIFECNKKGKLVITATQMLESMITNARPTRAEISDVANAVYDGSSVVMLSGESAAGNYPVESVKTMAEICEETEKHINYREVHEKLFEDFPMHFRDRDDTVRVTTILAAYTAAKYQRAKGLVIATHTGRSGRILSSAKPGCAIIACTDDKKVQRQLNLEWNVIPIFMETKKDSDELISECIEVAEKKLDAQVGDAFVILGNSKLGTSTDLIKIHISR